ncbi:uncharacterized protein LOC113225487 [Hyposmocoma kahamanoa]|uniref:uncharacterized protein LOC113225487 n=1 Tax=Hyposmocoma kahamanoa TaxID=1477025 RepID=UPI000E6D951B|nr:uncharacterized protein LOC113225487 [Hyposmocoma kahamanoa]
MEHNSYDERIGPLPGGNRRGAPGAGAGRGSMRAPSRGRLARPSGQSTHDPSPPVGMVSAGAGATWSQQSVPASGGVRRRMAWTIDMNKNAMRAYFRASGSGTGRTGYRAVMYREFLRLEPTLTVTEQNLADRVRYLQRSGLFSAAELEQLRCEAVPPLEEEPPRLERSPVPSREVHREPSAQQPDTGGTESDWGTVALDLEALRSSLEETILEYRHVPLERRPRLPRVPLSIKVRDAVGAINNMLPSFLEESADLWETDSILFAAAMTVCQFFGVRMPPTRPGGNHQVGSTTPRTSTKPAWMRRIEGRIAWARVLIGKLTSFRSGVTRPRVMRFVREAFPGENIFVDSPEFARKLTGRIDDLKQKIAAWGKRIRRYSERVKRYRQNRLFMSDQKKFYRTLERPDVVLTGERPDKAEVVAFWRRLWSQPVDHEEGPWFEAVERACATIAPMNPISISEEDVAVAVRKAPNWKSPGPDGLHHYWLKGFWCCHATLARQFQSALESGTLPNFLTTGVTHLAPKSDATVDPSQYRPITCLCTIYKTLTSVLSSKISQHIADNSVMSETQNGCRGGSRGSKELLLIDAVAGQLVRRNRRNFSAAWIDYRKAFDSVPHPWLSRVLELYKIDSAVRHFLGQCMGCWRTILSLDGRRMTDADDRIEIRRGIFQGDCLSPLWFCLALNPLSTLLERSGTGFQFRRGGPRMPHLLYMDDLKLYGPTADRLTELLTITNDFSSSVRMELGIDKCAVVHVEKGRVMHSDGINIGTNHLRVLSETETYRYLGMSQTIGVKEADVKQGVCEVFYGRLKNVLNSYLSGVNKIRAYNSWVMPVLMYTFGVLKWTQTELDALDRRVRTTMTSHRMHHPRSSVMRLYVPRKCGGRGLLSVKTMHNREICSLRNYFLTMTDDVIRGEVVTCDKGLTPLSLAKEEWRDPVVLSTSDRESVWKEKELHGRFFKNEPRGRPVTKVNNDELKVMMEADPHQTTKELAARFNVSIPTI